MQLIKSRSLPSLTVLVLLCIVGALSVKVSLESKNFTAIQLKTSHLPLGELNAIPEKLFAGEVHYSRIPVEYWEQRILMIKSLGLNALSVYVMWNYHQIAKGAFDYDSGNKNLTRFLQLAKRHEMYVLIRPGPYVCAEWDFGGLPARLLGIKDLVIRSDNKLYLSEVKEYFQSLAPILKPFLVSNKGPIILLQIENEFGFYGTNKNYINHLRTMWRDLKITVDEYYVDIAINLSKNHWLGANIGINGAIKQVEYDYAQSLGKKVFIFGGQIYSGWLTHWGEKWATKSIPTVIKEYEFLLTNNHSFSMYMVHGGTNFGLTAGANFGLNTEEHKIDVYQGDLTSYDYDAPIDEQGSPTQKFTALKQYMAKFITWDVPKQPQNIPMIQITAFNLSFYSGLFDNLRQPDLKNLSSPPYFESDAMKMYHQGMALYQTTLSKKTYYMTLQVHDYAIVYLNGNKIAVLDRSKQASHKLQVKCELDQCVFRVLVEAMGHINFGHQMEEDRKGLVQIKDDVQTEFKWNVYRFPLKEKVVLFDSETSNYAANASPGSPTIFKKELSLQIVGDTYLNMSQYTKGYVWVNGMNLGRYWTEAGPQKKLFCPGVWLRRGLNQIIVLDLHQKDPKPITGQQSRI